MNHFVALFKEMRNYLVDWQEEEVFILLCRCYILKHLDSVENFDKLSLQFANISLAEVVMIFSLGRIVKGLIFYGMYKIGYFCFFV